MRIAGFSVSYVSSEALGTLAIGHPVASDFSHIETHDVHEREEYTTIDDRR